MMRPNSSTGASDTASRRRNPRSTRRSAPGSKVLVGLSFYLVTLLVDRTVMHANRAFARFESVVGPPLPSGGCDALDKRQSAAGKRQPLSRCWSVRRSEGGMCPRPRPDLRDAAIGVLSHHYAARIACQTPGRFRGDVRTVLQNRLAGRVRIRHDRGIDVDHDLISLAPERQDRRHGGAPFPQGAPARRPAAGPGWVDRRK